MGSPARYHAEEEGPSARSAADGTFAIRLSRGEMVDLRATAEGLGQGDLAQCLAGERVTLVLRRGGCTVRVAVLDGARRPVGGAQVRFWIRSPESVYGRNAASREGTTGADGRCDFPHLPPGKATLTVDHPVLGQPGLQMPEVPAEGVLDLEVVLPAGRTVAGRVTDAATGKPLPGARVGSNWVMDRPVAADAEGRYAFPGWTGKGVSVLTAAAEGYGSTMRKVGDAGTLDFALEPAFRATGRAVAADGAPVAGARVGATGHWEDGDRSGSDRSAAGAGADGRFVLADLSRRARHDLVAEAEGHGRVFLSFEAPPEGEGVLDLGDVVLAPARAIEGRALDPSGEPLPGKDVNLARLRARDDPAWRDPRGSGAIQGMGEVRRTDDLGRFRFPGLSPGRWGLKLVVPGSPIVETEVELPADGDVLDVVLAEQGRSITFVVTDPEGKPLPDICVMTDMSFPHPTSGVRGTTSLQAATDAAGRAEFRSLPEVPGASKGIAFTVQPYVGEKAPPWAAHRTGPLVPGGQEVRVALRPVAWIRGRVLGPEEEPIPGLYVTALGPGGEALGGALAPCDGSGAFDLRVPEGETVTLRATGHRSVETKEGHVTVSDSGYRAELPGVAAPASGVFLRATRLAADRTLDVLVLDLEGRPVAGFPVNAWRTSGESRAGRTDDAGRVRFEAMTEDAWTLLPDLRVPGGMGDEAVPPAKVEVVPRGQEAVLRFRRGVPVEGIVLRPDGSPAPGAGLHYNLEGGGGGSVRPPRAGEDGRFRLLFGEGDALRIGAGWADGKGGFFTGESETVRPGQTGSVEVRLRPAEAR
jgi:protocatechuate 3,4-dioxygenase beta subunit